MDISSTVNAALELSRLFSGELVETLAVQPFRKLFRNGFAIEIGKGDVQVAVQADIRKQQDLAIATETCQNRRWRGG